MSRHCERSRVVIVDSRDPREEPLRCILERARVRYEVDLVATFDRVLEVVASPRPVAILLHAGFGPEHEGSAEGPLMAAFCSRHLPDSPLLLYSARLSERYEAALAYLGVGAPVMREQRLASDFERLLNALVEHGLETATLESACRIPFDASCGPRLPRAFRIEAFLDEAEFAITRAAIHEHPDRTSAAAALRMPLETFERYLGQRGLAIPRARAVSVHEPRLLWCSRRAALPWVREVCDVMNLDLSEVPPGTLHPRSVHSLSTIAALVEPMDAHGAVDLWTIARSVRPVLVASPLPTPVRIFLDQLKVDARPTPLVPPILRTLLNAGKRAADLYADEQHALRLGMSPGGGPAWPIDRAQLRRRLDARVILFAKQTEGSEELAAGAVALEPRTFRRRLRAARQILMSGSADTVDRHRRPGRTFQRLSRLPQLGGTHD